MAKKFDRAKLEAALKRAAKVATTGPRSARSGRFVSTGPAKRLSPSIVVEIVSSTAIDKIAYDADRKQLRLTFVSGRTYVYEDVPNRYVRRIDACGFSRRILQPQHP